MILRFESHNLSLNRWDPRTASHSALQDGDFSEQRFRDTVNAALANNIGNMLNRSLNLLAKNCEGAVLLDTRDGVPQDHPLRLLAKWVDAGGRS